MPSSTAMARTQTNSTGAPTAPADNTHSITVAATTLIASTAITGAAAQYYLSIEGMITVGGAGGTLAFNWAQNTSDAGNTIVRAGSYLEYMQVA
jgi:hypothetical protein